MNGLKSEQVAALRTAYGHLLNYEGDDPTAPIHPLTYRSADGDSLIHIAAFAGDSLTVGWLLDAGEDVNATGDMGLTAAHYAAANRSLDTYELLISRGGDPTVVDEFGLTPIETWRLDRSGPTIEYLRRASPKQGPVFETGPKSDIREHFAPGEIYEDCAYHPCLCIGVNEEDDEIWGISLIDGSFPRCCSLSHCGVVKLRVDEAWKMKQKLQGFRGR